ncbi:hypothetical protein BCR37DRAFT_208820 [Protomyces lactucae-debilis]|uniref:Short-chain dehydrogenase n=1 Tax=Protomyces lactucae-debilis TaxID=2754530 RepID=A0A1Y2FQC7_PROLT|nr:uncharacterized protein BCR37DRAFT_208820 [Protomyces lactucae-debilis]ORY86202.1 hypothetical protein BCR37DRAFT_208820 [Protomyces lactucae-debilis]
MPRLLITGVSPSSIGLETIRCILETQRVARQPQQWHIVLAQRDAESPQAKQAALQLQTYCSPGCTIESRTCDLESFKSVRAFVQDVTEPLDVVVLNAGLVSKLRHLTEDGIETTCQVNHLGHFLLLHLLQDKLMRGTRVVFVASSLHKGQDASKTLRAMHCADGPLRTTEPIYRPMTAYAQSKLLQAWCIAGWHRQLSPKGVQVLLASPGFVPTSGLAREETPLKQFLMRWVLHYAPFARSLEQAGKTIAACALADELAVSNVYIDANLKETRMHEAVYDDALAQEVWDWSRERCAIE